jgi:pimeloyl-ACP methyl ester carboxylesterase
VRTTVEISSGSTAALDTHIGASTRMPTVLFVPGYTGSKEDFLPLLRPLAAAGYRAIAIDQRGQYESSWSADPSGYTIESLAVDVSEICDGLGPLAGELHLVGHSFGGLVSRATVIAKPERFDSFTLMGSGPAAIGGARRELLEVSEPVLAEFGMHALWEQMAERITADPRFRDSPEALVSFLRTRFLANDPVGLQVMGSELRTATDRTEELAATGARILVLHGVADDAWLPEVQAEMAVRLGARHVVIDNAAHSPAVENPAATWTDLVRFWRAFTPPGGDSGAGVG